MLIAFLSSNMISKCQEEQQVAMAEFRACTYYNTNRIFLRNKRYRNRERDLAPKVRSHHCWIKSI